MSNRRKPRVVEAEVIETTPIIETGHEAGVVDPMSIYDEDPPDDEEDEEEGEDGDDEPSEFESLEGCIDQLKLQVVGLKAEVIGLRSEVKGLKQSVTLSTQASVSLAGSLNAVNEKLGGLAGLGKIGALFKK